MPRELREQLAQVCTRDRGRLIGRWRRLSGDKAPDAAKLDALTRNIAASIVRREARAAAMPAIALDESLPISTRADDIMAAIREQQIVVIAGETGSGKTTQLPKLCLAAGRGAAGLVGCTQPRRLAARSMAGRVAEEMNVPLGGQVGYQVRFTEKVSDDSFIKFMTDGILLAETQRDHWLSAYDTLIIDEAHERSLNIDFLLGYLKRLANKRPDLKIIVTSATIDTARFAEHFNDAPVIEVEGRAHPVDVRWRPLEAAGENGGKMQQGSAEHIGLALDEISAEDPRGDVLIFLPGEREIRDAHRLLSHRNYRHTEILPLYARLSAKDQDRVFKPGPARRVVLATNVAETSLTVPRIRYVIDTGTARVKRYSQRSQLERLHVEAISQAAADQRKGRCGRVGPGICVRLYDESDFESRPRYTDPELLRSSLANVILRMLDLGLGEVEDFPFLDAPESRAIADGYRRLAELQAVDEHKKLTAIGRDLARLPIDAQLARMLIEARALNVLEPILAMVAFLSVQDPRERPPDARSQADAAHKIFADPKSDFVGVLNLWQAYTAAHEELTQRKLRDWCGRNFLSYMRMREWREVHRQLRLQPGFGIGDSGIGKPGPGTRDSRKPGLGTRDSGLGSAGNRKSGKGAAKSATASPPARRGRLRGGKGELRPQPSPASGEGRKKDTGPSPESRVPSPEKYEAIHRALLSGLPTQVARKDEKGIFRSTRQRSFSVFPGSALAKSPPNWIFAAQILDLGGKVWGMTCARIEPRWIEQQAAHLLRHSSSDPHWSRKRGTVVAHEQVSLLGLVIVQRRTVTFRKQDPQRAHAIFLEQALARCDIDTRLDFVVANRRVLDKAEELEAKQRRQGLIRPEAELAHFFEGKMPADVASKAALEKWCRKASPAAQAALCWSLEDVLEASPDMAAGDFPLQLDLDGMQLRLEYRFVPGDAADGVTMKLPLALLNAVPAERCQWLVPGLLPDKVVALIKSLPKKLRRNFVPAPDFARAFCEAENARDEPLNVVLARFLQRTTGVDIAADAFAGAELPPHLCMRFRLIDDNGQTLASSRSLQILRDDWSRDARQAFSQQTDADISRERVEQWDFDDLPSQVRSAGGLDAYPALVDLGEAVAVRVFEQRDKARAEHQRGVERLLRLGLAPALKKAARKLPMKTGMGLKAVPLGSVDDLRADMVEGGLRDVLAANDLEVRTREAFTVLQATVESELFAAAVERLKLIEPIVEAQAELRPWLEPPLMGFATASYDDLHEQLEHLLSDGFVRELDQEHLHHLPRYLNAMRLRAERLRQDPGKDQQRMLEVLPCWRQYLKLDTSGPAHAALEALRWMIEEYRVSLFAQELGTTVKVSAKRLSRQMEQAKMATEHK